MIQIKIENNNNVDLVKIGLNGNDFVQNRITVVLFKNKKCVTHCFFDLFKKTVFQNFVTNTHDNSEDFHLGILIEYSNKDLVEIIKKIRDFYFELQENETHRI